MDETSSVQENEYVYRRIPRVYFNPTLQMPIQREAFRPTVKDGAGLSVFRALFAQPTDTLASVDVAKRQDYYVARLYVGEMVGLGLNIELDPLPGGPPGHAIIPMLSWPEYQSNKEHVKTILFELAKLASKDIVLHAS